MTERDNGPAIVGLGPSDFEVYDNGVLQQVDLVSFDEVPLNVILTLDMSDSVAGELLSLLLPQPAMEAIVAKAATTSVSTRPLRRLVERILESPWVAVRKDVPWRPRTLPVREEPCVDPYRIGPARNAFS